MRQLNYYLLTLLIIFLFLLQSCSKETVVENKVCSKTNYSNYKTYLKIPDNKIDYFSQVNIALILDTSGSMKGNKLDRAKEASDWLVDELDPRINIALLEFNTNSSILQDFTKNRNIIKNAIDSISAQGSTYYTPVLNLASKIFEKKINITNDKINNIIILLSDGQPKDSYKEILSEVNSLTNEKICIYTIGYTSKQDNESSELEKILSQISTLSINNLECGKFYSNVEEKNELVNVFKDIYTQIKTINYELFFEVKEKKKQIVLENNTINYHFRIKSIYNLNSIPNEDLCIDQIPIDFKIEKNNIIYNNFSSYLSYNNVSKEYVLTISNLSKGDYSLVLITKIKNLLDPEKDIKGYKKVEFSVVTNPEYLKCSSYRCNDYSSAILKHISKKIILNLSNYNRSLEIYSTPIKINFLNPSNYTKYVLFKNGREELSPPILPHSNYIHTFYRGNYKIYCSGDLKEYSNIISYFKDQLNKYNLVLKKNYSLIDENSTTNNGVHINDTNKKNNVDDDEKYDVKNIFLAIDNSLSMSGEKIKYAEIISKYLINDTLKNLKKKSALKILTFSSKPEFIASGDNKNINNILDNIKLDSNTDLYPLLKLINDTLVEDKTIAVKNINVSENKTNSSNTSFITKDFSRNSQDKLVKPKYYLLLISDGMIQDPKKIYDIALDLANKGLCINTFTFGNDTRLRVLSEISWNKTNCGKNYNKPKSYFKEEIPKRIIVNNYFEHPFNISVIPSYDNSELVFNKNLDVEFEITVNENKIKFPENYFGIVCPLNLKVIVEGYSDNNLVFTKSAEKLTDRHYFLKIPLAKDDYEIKVKVEGLDSSNNRCINIKDEKTILLDLTNKLI